MDTPINKKNKNDEFDACFRQTFNARWSPLLVCFLVRSVIAICGLVAFITDGVGIYVGDFIFNLIPANNITMNATEYEKKGKECMGKWSLGVELLTIIVVILIYLIKYLVLRCIINEKQEKGEEQKEHNLHISDPIIDVPV